MDSLNQFRLFRTLTLNVLKGLEESQWDVQPPGQPNTIRWNAGHLYITGEVLMNKADNQYEIHRKEWEAFFSPGTRPSEWTEEPPSPADIIVALKEQRERIPDYFSGKLQNKASEAFVIGNNNMDTVDLLVHFISYHEGHHSGIMKTLKNIQ